MFFLQQKIKKTPAGFVPHIKIKLSMDENFVKIVFTHNPSGIPKAPFSTSGFILLKANNSI
jgi:hypothetical protein